MIALHEYFDANNRSRYKLWFDQLDVAAATRVAVALERIAQGNQSSIKSVGGRVSEYKIDFGPGYRIYFGWDGDELVILLGGGTKKRQSQDIAEAQAAWKDYKQRKKDAEATRQKAAKLQARLNPKKK